MVLIGELGRATALDAASGLWLELAYLCPKRHAPRSLFKLDYAVLAALLAGRLDRCLKAEAT